MFHLISITLSWGMQWYHWWCNQHYVMSKPMVSQDEKSHLAPNFNHLDLMIAMMALMTTMASFDASSSANGITWPECHVVPHFDHLHLRNAVVPLMMPFASFNTGPSTNSIMWPKGHVAVHFNCLHLRNAVVSLMTPLMSCNNNASITWCSWQHQWYCMSKKSFCT